MSREFNPRETLARLLPSTVQRYFGQYLNRPDVADSIVASDESSETNWNAVPAELQERVIGDLRAVYDLADEKGMKCLLDEARYHGLDLPAEFVDNAGLEDKALAALVASEDVFRVATVMRQADALHGNCWKRWAGLSRGSSPERAAIRIVAVRPAWRTSETLESAGRLRRGAQVPRPDPTYASFHNCHGGMRLRAPSQARTHEPLAHLPESGKSDRGDVMGPCWRNEA